MGLEEFVERMQAAHDDYRRSEAIRESIGRAAASALAAREEYQARRAAREARRADEELAGLLAYEAAAGRPLGPARFRGLLPGAGPPARLSVRTMFW